MHSVRLGCLLAVFLLHFTPTHQQRLSSTKLEYREPYAGEATEITISYTPLEEIADGEVLKIVLSQFTGPDGYVEVNHSSPLVYAASWTEAKSELLLTAKQTPVGNPVTLSIKEERGIRLPDTGVIQNSLQLTIAKGLQGIPYGFTSSPAIGSFIYSDFPTSLRYETAVPGTAVQGGRQAYIFVSFKARMQLLTGETVRIRLKDFTGESKQGLALSPPEFAAEWVEASEELVLTYIAVDPLPIGAPQTVTVTPHILLPAHGLPADSPTLSISSNAKQGPVLATPIVVSPTVKSLVLSSSAAFNGGGCSFNGYTWGCHFQPAQAAAPAELEASFSLAFPLRPQCTLTLHLPSFTGAPFSSLPAPEHSILSSLPPELRSSSDAASPSADAPRVLEHPYRCAEPATCEELAFASPAGMLSWQNSSALLTFRPAAPIEAGTLFSVVAPQAFGIASPDNGLRALGEGGGPSGKDGELLFAATCEDTELPWTAFRTQDPIGAFQRFSIDFFPAPPRPASTTGITITFAPHMRLLPSEPVSVALPSFAGAGNAATLAASLRGGGVVSVEVTWDAPAHRLRLAAASEIPAGVELSLQLPVSFGLGIPPEGVVDALLLPSDSASPAAISASADASLGRVPAFAPAAQRVPALVSAPVVSFSAASAAEGPTELSIAFTPGVALAAGDTLSVSLPGFFVSGGGRRARAHRALLQASILPLSSAPSGAFRSGSWDPATSQLSITAEAAAPAGRQETITIPASSGLFAPLDGQGGAISVQAAVGGASMPAATVEGAPVVQPAVLDSILWFDAASRAGRPAGVYLNLTTHASLALGAGSSVGLVLPGFEAAAGPLACSSAPAGLVEQCAWDAAAAAVTFSLGAAVGSGRPFSLAVPLQPDGTGISMPEAGVGSEDTPSFTVQPAGGAALGPAFVRSSDVVGAFHREYADSSIEFRPVAAAGAVVALRIALRPYMRLESGETVEVTLDGFSAASGDSLSGIATAVGDAFAEASWSGVEHRLTLTVGDTAVSAGAVAVATIPADVGLTVPGDGIPRCKDWDERGGGSECEVWIATDAVAGPVARTPFFGYIPVGAVRRSEMTATPRLAGEAVELKLSLVLSMALTTGDDIRLSLPGFKLILGPTAFNTPPNGTFGQGLRQVLLGPFSAGLRPLNAERLLATSQSRASWNQLRTGVVILASVAKGVVAGREATLVIPVEAGVRLPEEGIPRGTSGISFSIFARDGDVNGAPVLQPPVIGAFSQRVLVIDPPLPGEQVRLELRFVATMPLEPDETLVLTLPFFNGPSDGASFAVPSTAINVSSMQPAPAIASATWDNEAWLLTMTVATTIPAGTPITAEVPLSAGIAAPINGVVEGSLTVHTEAAAGGIDVTPLPTDQVVALLYDAALGFGTPKAGDVSSLTLRVTSRQRLVAGDAISLYLPTFGGGRECWEIAEGEPGSELRCVVDILDGIGGVRPCRPCGEECRYFRERDERGCLVRSVSLAAGVPEAEDRRLLGQCRCLNHSAEAFEQFTFEAPAGYGNSCRPWDRDYDGVQCPVTRPPSQLSPWCCVPWCFVDASCPSAAPFGPDPSFFISYANCPLPPPSDLQTCPWQSLPRQAGLVNASWVFSDPEPRLVVTFIATIPQYAPMTLTIGADARIRTPEIGLEDGDPIVTIAGHTKFGAMDRSPLDAVQAIGVVRGRSQLAFLDPPHAGRPTTLNASFVMSAVLVPGDSVSLSLPGFSRPPPEDPADASEPLSTVRVASLPPNAVASAAWNAETETLTFPVSSEVAAFAPFSVVVPAPFLQLPFEGIRSGQRAIALSADARFGSIPVNPPTPVDLVPAVGALSFTALTFDPAIAGQAMGIRLQWVNEMPMQAGDVITLTLPFFTGPEGSRSLALTEQAPPSSFRVTWQHQPAAAAAFQLSYIRIELLAALAAGTPCTIAVPASCAFSDSLGVCVQDAPPITCASPAPAPSSLTLEVDSVGGDVLPSPIRLSTRISTGAPFGGFTGRWEGLTAITAGYRKDLAGSTRLECISDSLVCPSLGGYSCFTLGLPTTLVVNGSTAWMAFTEAEQEVFGLGATFFYSSSSAWLSLESQSGAHLTLTNQSTGQTYCVLARARHRVDLDGRSDVVLELLSRGFFRAVGTGALNVRLRLKILPIEEFNPFDLELAGELSQSNLLTSLAILADVPVEFVRYAPSLYPPVTECDRKPECNLEFEIEASTQAQVEGVLDWSADMSRKVTDKMFDELMSKENLNIRAELLEAPFVSYLQTREEQCPEDDSSHFSPARGRWVDEEAQVRVPSGDGGVMGLEAATCLHREGADDGARVVFEDSYSLSFRFYSVLFLSDAVGALDGLPGFQEDSTKEVAAPLHSSTGAPATPLLMQTAVVLLTCWYGIHLQNP